MDSISRLPLCSHLLQQNLRDVCIESEWVYSVFWRILPRNFPPPKWELGGYLDRTKANKRNWILVWEDGFCDFARSSTADDGATVVDQGDHDAGSCTNEKRGHEQMFRGSLHPELFFKMSHEIYNYGEGLMGKVAADNGHKWVYRDPPDRDNRLVSFWHNTIDPQPRTWEAQFKSGIQTIVVIAVREGLVQLGSTRQILEDLNFVVLLQRKFNSLQQMTNIPSPMQAQPSCASSSYAALQSMLSPDQSTASLERKMRHGRPDEEEPAFRRTLERRLSWSSGTVSDSRRSSSTCRPSQLDPLIHDKYPLGLFDIDLHLRQQPFPLAHDVQAAVDHLSLSSTTVPAICGTSNLQQWQCLSNISSMQGGVNASPYFSSEDASNAGQNMLRSAKSSGACTVPSTSATVAISCGATTRPVLPSMSNLQALLMKLPVVTSTSCAVLNQQFDGKSAVLDHSPLLRTLSAPASSHCSTSSKCSPVVISVPDTTWHTSSSSSQLLSSAGAFQRAASGIPNLTVTDHRSFLVSSSSPQFEENQSDGGDDNKSTVPKCRPADVPDHPDHNEGMMMPTQLESSMAGVDVQLDPEGAASTCNDRQSFVK